MSARFRPPNPWKSFAWACLITLAGSSTGCGTTRWTDTARTGNEQLLLSDSVDQAVAQIDFSVLADRSVYLDPQFLGDTQEQRYLVSSLRQHLAASGAWLRPTAEEADYIVEPRIGGIGTNRDDALLLGIPETTVPAFVVGVPGGRIPEIPLIKTTTQTGVTKVTVFAYQLQTGAPLWQSGTAQGEAVLVSRWIFGVGPLRQGTGSLRTPSVLRRPFLLARRRFAEEPPNPLTREAVFELPAFYLPPVEVIEEVEELEEIEPGFPQPRREHPEE